jgi:protease I
MPSVVMVLAPTVFRDEEYAQPKAVLESRGAHVSTASTEPGLCTGRFGLEATATLSLAEAAAQTWDAVVFIGGGGSRVFFDDPTAHTLARAQIEGGRVLAAICIAPTTLARAGLLGGVRATAFPDSEADLRAGGARWTGDPVTVDGLIITGSGPEAATAFGEAIAQALGI